MNKKIVMSLSVIAAAAAVVMGGTSAFFSDTETSTGNTFTAGAIDLKVSNHSYYNGLEMPNLSWESKDLETGNLFFDFADLKPGDLGEDTIDLTVNNNDAYACMDIDVTGTPENGINEPEAADDQTDGTDEGELQDELHMTFWADDGDNVLELDEESTIFVNNKTIQEISDGGTVTLADSVSNVWNGTGAMTGAQTYYIGKVFCFGNLTQAPVATDAGENPSVASGFTCSGATVTNASQTDGVTGNVSFTAIQSRNNGDFKCSTDNGGLTVADSYGTGFEPSIFSVGNINGQDGWEKTGPYDAVVVSDPVIADLQSLRISNAITSGAFGDQTFAPELASGAGENGVGAENHFEAEFKIKSTQSTVQPGLALSVSPDDGNGSRMSYLSFADEAGGIRVTFYDVQGTTNPANFVSTDLGILDRSTSHTIKFVMDFVDGPSNDIVKISIDGSLVHTGTSWENYFRYDSEQVGNGNNLFPVDTLIFRAAGAAVPANSGKGFLFDNVSLLSGSI